MFSLLSAGLLGCWAAGLWSCALQELGLLKLAERLNLLSLAENVSRPKPENWALWGLGVGDASKQSHGLGDPQVLTNGSTPFLMLAGAAFLGEGYVVEVAASHSARSRHPGCWILPLRHLPRGLILPVLPHRLLGSQRRLPGFWACRSEVLWGPRPWSWAARPW